MRHKRLAVAAAGAVVAAMAIGGCSAASTSSTAHTSTSTAAAAKAASAEGSAEAAQKQCEATGGLWYPTGNGTCQAEAAPAPATPAATTPSMTVSEQQAVDSAQGYLADGQGFSEQGLTTQLTSSYGAGFSQADAKFAIGYLHPDWDAQAVDAAKGIEQVLHYGREALIQQLTSSFGSGFTESQAEYAATQVGL